MDRPSIPLVAFAASLFMAGGGQVYNRQPLKALVFWVLFWVVLARIGPVAFLVAVASGVEAMLVSLALRAEERPPRMGA